MEAPCKGCERRYVGCHSDCFKYKVFKRKTAEIKEKEKAVNETWRTHKANLFPKATASTAKKAR